MVSDQPAVNNSFENNKRSLQQISLIGNNFFSTRASNSQATQTRILNLHHICQDELQEEAQHTLQTHTMRH